MAIKVETSFVVPAPIERAWEILTDVPRIAPCMPGAELTEIVAPDTYKGIARVKIGPVQLMFNGEARLTESDAVKRVSRLSIRGADSKGRGHVHSEMTFSLAPEGAATRVNVITDLTLSGAVAQYGRGAGLIKEVCNQFALQFANNLVARIESGADGADASAAKPLSALGLVSGAVRAMVTRKTQSGQNEQDDTPPSSTPGQ